MFRPEYRLLTAWLGDELGGQLLEEFIVVSNGFLGNPEQERFEWVQDIRELAIRI